MSSVHSHRTSPMMSPVSSRAPSPFEIQQARRIVVYNPEGEIEMFDLSRGVQDAFVQARRDLSTPSPQPSPPQSRSSSPAASLRTMRSVGSASPIVAPPADAETKEMSRGKKACVFMFNVMGMVGTVVFFGSMIYLAYIKSKKD